MTSASGSAGLKRGMFSAIELGQAGPAGRPSVGRRKGFGLGLGSLGGEDAVLSLTVTSPWKQCPNA